MTVLLPTAAALRRALTHHAEAVGRDERHPTPGTARARADAAYTLCVLTGTRGVGEALRTAQTLLDRARRRAPALVALPAPGRPASPVPAALGDAA